MNKKNVIYHVGHYGFFEKSLLYHFTYTKHLKAIFLVDEHFFSDSTKEFIHNLINNKFAIIIEIYDENLFMNEPEEYCQSRVINYFDKLLEKYEILEDNSEFYSGFDTLSAFTAYLNLKRIHYHIFDIGLNTVSMDRYGDNSGQVSAGYDKLLRTTNCLSIDAEFVDSVIWNCNEYNSKGKKFVTLDYVKLAKNLQPEEKILFRKIFNMPVITPGRYYLIILSSAWVLWYYNLPKEMYYDTYKFIADYSGISRNMLIIKQHPNFDVGVKIQELFKDAISIHGFTPITLLSCYDNLEIISAFSTGSSGGLGFNTLSFPLELIRNPIDIHLISAGIIISGVIGKSPRFDSQYENQIFSNLPHFENKTDGIKTVIFNKNDVNYNSYGLILFRDLKSFIAANDHFGHFEVVLLEKNGVIENMGFIQLKDDNLRPVKTVIELTNYGGKVSILPFNNINSIFNWLRRIYSDSHTSDGILDQYRQCSLCISKMYKQGIIVSYDLFTALSWAKMGLELGTSNSENLIFDICWAIGTPDSYKLMIDSISKKAVRCDSTSLAQLGIAYSEGKGVEKNQIISAALLRQARSQGLLWANWALFDTLWKTGTSQAYSEMISIALPLAKSGNAQLQARIGRAYKEGKGVEKNLDNAAKWMKKAADQGLQWAITELSEIEDIRKK